MQVVAAQGMRMPKLGLGTWAMTGRACTAAVSNALSMGYRHIDTAQMYGNEAEVGLARKLSGLPREELFVVTKASSGSLAPDSLRRAFDASMKALGCGYVDLYLIHWPTPSMDLPATLAAMQKLREQGLIRHIGVSNFTVALMRQAVEEIGAPIACNQVEYHVLLGQSRVLHYARSKGIAVTAYCPLARGGLGRVRELVAIARKHGATPEQVAIARKHGATPEQVALKWLLDQEMVAAIPKASRPENQRANLDALKLTLDDADRAAIAALPKNERVVNAGFPKWDPAD
jgi:2,5-diketo-D-gluconate reductase B